MYAWFCACVCVCLFKHEGCGCGCMHVFKDEYEIKQTQMF